MRDDFSEGSGDIIHDRSGVGQPLDLVIDKSSRVRWSQQGSLIVAGPSSIASAQPARKIIDAVKKANALTIEVWLKPANASQSGPARIVTLSMDTSNRNLTLGQDKTAYDVRLRATGSDKNGLPSTSTPTGSLKTKLTHVVFTRNTAGKTFVYIDGKPAGSQKVNGDFGNWDAAHSFVVGQRSDERSTVARRTAAGRLLWSSHVGR